MRKPRKDSNVDWVYPTPVQNTSNVDWVYPTPVQNTVAAQEILSANPGPEEIRLGIKLLNKGLEQQKVALSGSQKLVSDADQCRTDPAWANVRPHYVPEQHYRPERREDNYSRTTRGDPFGYQATQQGTGAAKGRPVRKSKTGLRC